MSTLVADQITVFPSSSAENELKGSWGWILTVGILTAIVGLFAMAMPLMTTLATPVIFGWFLVIHGICEFFHAFKARKRGGFGWLLFGAVMTFLAGAVMVVYPFASALSLTMFLAFMLVFIGIERIVVAFRLRPTSGWGWVLFNGILTTSIGFMIMNRWPSSALWVIGLFIGVNILMSGFSMISFSLLLRSLKKAEGGVSKA